MDELKFTINVFFAIFMYKFDKNDIILLELKYLVESDDGFYEISVHKFIIDINSSKGLFKEMKKILRTKYDIVREIKNNKHKLVCFIFDHGILDL
jgi:hypothetical protein